MVRSNRRRGWQNKDRRGSAAPLRRYVVELPKEAIADERQPDSVALIRCGRCGAGGYVDSQFVAGLDVLRAEVAASALPVARIGPRCARCGVPCLMVKL